MDKQQILYRITLDYSKVGTGVFVDVSFWADTDATEAELKFMARNKLLDQISHTVPVLDEVVQLDSKWLANSTQTTEVTNG